MWLAWVGSVVYVEEALVIAVHCSGHGRPGSSDAEVAGDARACYLLALERRRRRRERGEFLHILQVMWRYIYTDNNRP